MGRYRSYFSYVCRHKWYVFRECCRLGIPVRGLFHDMEKLAPREFIAYAHHFYDRNGKARFDTIEGHHLCLDDSEQVDFLRSYRLHVIRNQHHWQYWVITDNHGKQHIVDMPLAVRKELLADWLGVERALKSGTTLSWYENNRERLVLDIYTREWLDGQLGYVPEKKEDQEEKNDNTTF